MTLRRWVARFGESGRQGLIDSPRRDKGISQQFRNRTLAAIFVLSMHVEGSTPSAIHKALAQEWPRLYRDGSRPPCYNTVLTFIKSASPVVSGSARKSRRKQP